VGSKFNGAFYAVDFRYLESGAFMKVLVLAA